MRTSIRPSAKLSDSLFLILFFVSAFLVTDAQKVEINGTLEISTLSQDNTANELLIKKSDGKVGTRDVSSLPTSEIPSSGIILSDSPSNALLLNAGFQEIGKQSIQYATRLLGEWSTNSIIGAPVARSDHSAIWTGSHMIVWGGRNSMNTFRDGGLYDPVNDTWATFQNNSPVGRSQHTAVWTGTEMIVWGGIDGSGEDPLGSGRRLLPSTLIWTIMSTIQAPSERTAHTAIWTGSEMIVWGGTDGNAVYGDGASYNPNTDTWTSISSVNAPSPRFGHSAVWTGSEMIVWGGLASGVGFFKDGKSYNPLTDTWTTISSTNVPDERAYHSSVWTGEKMIIWGGLENTGSLNTGGIYNPLTDSWVATALAGAPNARYSHEAVWTGSVMIIYGAGASFEEAKLYNPTSNRWLAIDASNAPAKRINSTAIWSGNDLIVWGGIDNISHTNTGGKLDPNALGNYGAYDAIEFYLYRKE